jgi:hypothetical protein
MKRNSKSEEKEKEENKGKRKIYFSSQEAFDESVLRIKKSKNNSETADSEWYA